MPRPSLGPVAVAIASIAAILTRIPSPEFWVAPVSVALGILTIMFAIPSPNGRHGLTMGGIVFVLACAHLLLPSSPIAVLANAPPSAAALAFGVALHVLFAHGRTHAPLAAEARFASSTTNIVRHVPTAITLALIVGLPAAYTVLLPDRFRSTYELTTPIGAMVPLIIVGCLLLLLGLVRQFIEWMRWIGLRKAEQRLVKQHGHGTETQ